MTKTVCDKVVCQRWRVTKLCVCVKGGVKELCVTKLGVTKLCGKDGVWQSCVCERKIMCVTKVVCDKAVCKRWCGKL